MFHSIRTNFVNNRFNYNDIPPPNDTTTQACNGCEGKDAYGDYYDGEHYNNVTVYCGSLIVNPGCTFTGYSGDDYDGEKQQFNPGE